MAEKMSTEGDFMRADTALTPFNGTVKERGRKRLPRNEMGETRKYGRVSTEEKDNAYMAYRERNRRSVRKNRERMRLEKEEKTKANEIFLKTAKLILEKLGPYNSTGGAMPASEVASLFRTITTLDQRRGFEELMAQLGKISP